MAMFTPGIIRVFELWNPCDAAAHGLRLGHHLFGKFVIGGCQ